MQQYEDQDYTFKLVMVGNIFVGKSCLMSKYLSDYSPQHYRPTIGVEFGTKNLHISTAQGSQKIKLHIWDTSGQERYQSLSRSYFKGSDGVILTFSLDNLESFQKMNDWINMMENIIDPSKISIFLVGNKLDIEQREVTFEEGMAMAISNGFEYREASAKTGEGVRKVFDQMAKMILERRLNEEYKKKERYTLTKKVLNNKKQNGHNSKCCRYF